MWGFLGQTGLGMCATLSRCTISEGGAPSILISKFGLGRQSFAIPKDPNAPRRVANWDGEGAGKQKPGANASFGKKPEAGTGLVCVQHDLVRD